jgi:hypothetical protein
MTDLRKGATMKVFLMISAFTLVFTVSASAQVRRPDNTTLGDQPSWRTQNWCDTNGVLSLCRDGNEQQRRRERVRDERPATLGDQPSWRTQNWCDTNGVLSLCRH